MILPIQRIPRYELLLKELLKYTATDHKDRENLESSLAKVKDVAERINEGKRNDEKFRVRKKKIGA